MQDDLYKGAYSFGVLADELANLVVTNQKTATSSLAIMYELEQEQSGKREEKRKKIVGKI